MNDEILNSSSEINMSELINSINNKKGGLFHLIHYHDDDCQKLKGGECNCEPDIQVRKDNLC